MSSRGLFVTLSGTFVLAIGIPLIGVLVFGLLALQDLSALRFMAQTTLPEYLASTLVLCLGSLTVALLLGLPAAWFLSAYRVPFRRVLLWAQILPLAMPAYVVAYAYTDALDYSGWISTWLRAVVIDGQAFLGLPVPEGRQPWPEVRSLWGACLVLGATLCPYVSLLARTAFEERQQSLLEVSRSLGLTSREAFFRVALPMARPALVAGSALVVMECLADFGTVAFFSVQTLSTGLFKTWLNYGDRYGAALIGLVMLFIALGLLAWERRARGRASFASKQRGARQDLQPLHGWARVWVPLICGLGGLLGFVLPLLLLMKAAFEAQALVDWPLLVDQATQTLLYGLYALFLILPIATCLAYFIRVYPRSRLVGSVRLAASGYAVPGLVVAIGLLSVSGLFTMAMEGLLDWRVTLTTTSALVIGGYLTRYFSVGFSSIEASLGRITPSLDWAARSLGLGPWGVLRRLHLPMLRGGVGVAALLVFVDVVKELPITLTLRPFDTDTLAVAAYNFAADERLAEAAWPSLAIALVGVLPLFVLGPRSRQT